MEVKRCVVEAEFSCGTVTIDGGILLVMEQLDLSEVYGGYSESQGLPPFNPTMMTALLLYSYSQGIYSSELTESTNGNKDSTRRTPLPISATKANR